MDTPQALALLNSKQGGKLGPFTFDEAYTVTLDGHPKLGEEAIRFVGDYHRHHFYVFDDGDIEFRNDEEEDPLWDS